MKKSLFNSETKKAAEKHLKQSQKSSETKRIQCILFCCLGMESPEIAPLVGYHETHVRLVWKWFREGGWDRVLGERRGQTRNKAFLTEEEEMEFLSGFEERARSGQIVTSRVIQQAHADLVGKELDETVTYRLLKRHGWMKKTARPEHPQQDKEKLKRFRNAIFPPGYDPYENISHD
jgi:transposase